MPDTVTPNYGFTKPEEFGSTDTWGGKLNTDWDIADTQIKVQADAAAAANANANTRVLKAGDTMTGQLTLPSGGASAALNAASLAQVQTAAASQAVSVGGTADALTLTMAPPVAALVTGQVVRWISSGPNTVTTPTIAVDATGVKNLRKENSAVLAAGDTGASGRICEAVYNGTSFLLLNPAVSTASFLTAPVSDVSILHGTDYRQAVQNAGFTEGDFGYTKGTGWAIAADSANALIGNYVAVCTSTSGTATALTAGTLAEAVQCEPGDEAYVEAYLKVAGWTGTVLRGDILWLDKDFATIVSSNGNNVSPGSGSYTVSSVSGTAPAGAAFFKARAVVTMTAGTAYCGMLRAYKKIDAAKNIKPASITSELLAPGAQASQVAIRETSNTIVSSTTLTADAVLRFPMAANTKYSFAALVALNPAGGGIKYGVTGPASPTVVQVNSGRTGTGNVDASFTTSYGQLESNSANDPSTVNIYGFISNGAVAGDLALTFAQDTSNAAGTQVRAGSQIGWRAVS
jgi:hypothetical protein